MRGISTVFRKHPELEATGKLSLLGESRCTAEKMDAYLKRRNSKAPNLAEIFLRQGKRYGIRGDVAFCQMVYETRGWTAQVSGPYWAPMTLNQWALESSVEGIMQILYAFAAELPIPEALEAVDQISKHSEMLDRAGWRGKTLCWEDLNGKWTRSGQHYGQDIVAIWRSMLEWKGNGESKPKEGGLAMEISDGEGSQHFRTPRERTSGNVDWSSFYTEEMKWLQDQSLLPSPDPHPERKVSWAELAALLQKWEKQRLPATIDGNEVPSNE